MHNDLCPTNIILQNDMPIIIDFGRSRGVSDQGDIISCYGYEDFFKKPRCDASYYNGFVSCQPSSYFSIELCFYKNTIQCY